MPNSFSAMFRTTQNACSWTLGSGSTNSLQSAQSNLTDGKSKSLLGKVSPTELVHDPLFCVIGGLAQEILDCPQRV
jgi:hypothetical protein